MAPPPNGRSRHPRPKDPDLDHQGRRDPPHIYRLSTLVPEIGPTGFTFNQFVRDDDEPLLFHTGYRSMFPSVSAAIEQVLPLDRLRWIAFGHVESDACGAMHEFLAAAPQAQVLHGGLGCMVSLNEMADRPPRPMTHLGDGPALTEGDILGPAADDLFRYSSLAPSTPTTIERLADLQPRTVALIHGSSFTGDGQAALRALADAYTDRLQRAG